MKKIVVTGMGAVTPVGIGVENYWNNITAGASGIDTIKTFDPSELAVQIAGEVKDFNPSDYLPKDLIRKTDPFMQYAYIAGAAMSGRFRPRPRCGSRDGQSVRPAGSRQRRWGHSASEVQGS